MTIELPPTPAWWPAPSGGPVMVVGPNPAMDRLQVISHMEPGAVHRVRTVRARAGGKSFIVARSIRALGTPVDVHGFLGGAAGELARAECADLDLGDKHTAIAADTRITPVIIETKSGRSTVFNEPGPHLTADEMGAFWSTVESSISPDRIVVCTGSLPPDMEADTYRRIVTAAAERGAYAAVDSHGKVLRHALEARPWLVKCNVQEFGSVLREDASHDDDAVRTKMMALIQDGVGIVIVTMGSQSFLVATADGVWSVSVPTVSVVNATGSGDTFLAAFVASVQGGASFAEALAFAAAGGAFNAAHLEPGLTPDADLGTLAGEVRFTQEIDVTGGVLS
jgi:1-phosphofructokinase family hexose kinase